MNGDRQTGGRPYEVVVVVVVVGVVRSRGEQYIYNILCTYVHMYQYILVVGAVRRGKEGSRE